MTTIIEAGADIIDVRDIIARVEKLREDRADLQSTLESAEEDATAMSDALPDTGDQEALDDAIQASKNALQASRDWDDGEDAKELETLEELLSNLCGYGGDEQWEGDWYPVTLIHENYFTQHAQELADDIGAVDRDAKWPNTHIDWEAAAEDLKQDYSTVEFEGNTYYYR